METLAFIFGIYAVIVLLVAPFIVGKIFHRLRELQRHQQNHNDLLQRIKTLELTVSRLQGSVDTDASAPITPIAPKQRFEKDKEVVQESADASPWSEIKEPYKEPNNKTYLAPLVAWLKDNWVLAVAALSLILGGYFMVLYSIENNLISPKMRIISALTIGIGMTAGAEYLRRQFGHQTTAMKNIPATLSGAGFVVMFMAVFGSHALYHLISPLMALLGMALISILAILAGWLYGPVISIIGLIGGAATPLLISGDASDLSLLYPYYAMLGLLSLTVDTIKRYHWLAVLAVPVTSTGLLLMWQFDPRDVYLAGSSLALSIGAICLPIWQLSPSYGPDPIRSFITRPISLPLLVACLGVFSGLAFMGLLIFDTATIAISFDHLIIAYLVLAIGIMWLRQAPALTLILILGLSSLLAATAWLPHHHHWGYPVEIPTDAHLWLAGLGFVLTLVTMLRSLNKQSDNLYWAYVSAFSLPALVFIVEFKWLSNTVPVSTEWVVTILASAAVLATLARFRLNKDPQGQLQSALYVATGFVLVGLAAFLLLSEAALTMALALLLVLVSQLEKRFSAAPLAWLMHLTGAIIAYRLLMDPGIPWSLYKASEISLLLAHGAPILAWWLIYKYGSQRADINAVCESAGILTLSMLVGILLTRQVNDVHNGAIAEYGILAALWLATAVNQGWRWQGANKWIRAIRLVAIGIAVITGIGYLANMLFTLFILVNASYQKVLGIPLLDTLTLALIPTALVTIFVSWKLVPRLGLHVRYGHLATTYAALQIGLWIYLEIRHLWRGPVLASPGPSDGELYTYTVAMMIASGACLLLAFMRRSLTLRKLAMVGICLTIFKVFLIDMSDLSGIVRIVSLMALGLSLLGLVWLNRLIDANWHRSEQETQLTW